MATALGSMVGLGLMVGLLAGCGGNAASEPESASASAAPVTGSLTLVDACTQVYAVMDAVNDDPNEDQVKAINAQLDTIAQQSPSDLEKVIKGLESALTQAVSVPDGFDDGSPTESKFVLAGQEVQIVCEPEGPDPEGTPSANEPSDVPAVP